MLNSDSSPKNTWKMIYIGIFEPIFKRVKISIFYWKWKSKLVMGRFLIFNKNRLRDFFVYVMDVVNDLGGYWTILMTSPHYPTNNQKYFLVIGKAELSGGAVAAGALRTTLVLGPCTLPAPYPAQHRNFKTVDSHMWLYLTNPTVRSPPGDHYFLGLK